MTIPSRTHLPLIRHDECNVISITDALVLDMVIGFTAENQAYHFRFDYYEMVFIAFGGSTRNIRERQRNGGTSDFGLENSRG